jgi:hypothetical protein
VIKFRTEQRTRQVPHTIDGTTNLVPETYAVRIPKIPADWDALAVKGAAGLVLALTVAAVVWSTFSIGALLGGGVGLAAAAVFDLAWLVNVLLEWLSRYDPAKRAFSKRLGAVLLVCTMGAIFWHGLLSGSVALGVVGAAVSLFAKLLWVGIMRFVDKDLSEGDAAWVAAEISKANAKLAVAGVRRQAARAEGRAAAELLAAEAVRAEFADLVPAAVPSSADRPAVSAQAPASVSELPNQSHGTAALPGAASSTVPQDTNGTPDTDDQDDEQEAPAQTNRRPATRKTQRRPAGTGVPSRVSVSKPVTSTDGIRAALADGITEVAAIHARLTADGIKVPDPSYTRRKVREFRRANAGTGQYL